jgi:UTP--glucose-1-phosphate uridylyltransferase
VGRYVLSPKLFVALEQLSSYAAEELSLGEAITAMSRNNERVFAYKVQGTCFDVGTPMGWLRANIEAALRQEHNSKALESFLYSKISFPRPEQAW